MSITGFIVDYVVMLSMSTVVDDAEDYYDTMELLLAANVTHGGK